MYYINIYDKNGNYCDTDYLTLYKVITKDFTLTSTTPENDLGSYWIDYIKSNSNLKLYENDFEISELSNDGNEHFIKIIDNKNNIYAIHYKNITYLSDEYDAKTN